jgi:REP element-mobilizing transposase RayT
VRLSDFDYSQVGVYFVTVCSHERKCTFGRVESGAVELFPLGRIVRESWLEIPYHFARVELDTFVVMPNHLHGVLVLHEDFVQRAQHAAPLQIKAASLPAVLRSFKAAATKRARDASLLGSNPLWQRNYYEHIVRPGEALNDIRKYVSENPARWALDKENPERISNK